MTKAIVTQHLNVRKEPNLNYPELTYYKSGSKLNVVRFVKGQMYRGNDVWFQLSDGNYVWSGAVQIDKETPFYQDMKKWMNAKGFTDIHCHSTYRVLTVYSTTRDEPAENLDPWYLIPSNLRMMARGNRAHKYGQSDVPRMVYGNVKLSIVALYCIEQAFLSKISDYKQKVRSGETYEDVLKRAGETEGGALNLEFSGVTAAKARYVLSNQYDYYYEMLKEYRFYLRKSGMMDSAHIFLDEGDDGTINTSHNIHTNDDKISVEGRYYVVSDQPGLYPNDTFKFLDWKSYKDKTTLEQRSLPVPNHNEIQTISAERINSLERFESAIVYSIEGMHNLNMKNELEEVPEDVLWSRLKEVKQLSPPIFYVTFAHHFNNGLCAHARSIPIIEPIGKIIKPKPLNQVINMNYIGSEDDNDNGSHGTPTDASKLRVGFTKKGIKALGMTLNVEIDLEEKTLLDKGWYDNITGRRIFVDVKHLSAAARLNYYEYVIRPMIEYAEAYGGAPIPVIASHVAFSGVDTLNDMIESFHKEPNRKFRANDTRKKLNFSAWNINMSKEDVEIITRSKGLIGIIMDQRGLGLDFIATRDGGGVFKYKVKRKLKKMGMDKGRIFVHNIIEMAKGIKERVERQNLSRDLYKYHSENHNFWKCICIGSDFDGSIDPVEEYPTFTEYDNLRDDLIEAFDDLTDEVKGVFGLSNKTIITKMVDDFSIHNTINFVQKHFQMKGQPNNGILTHSALPIKKVYLPAY